MAQQLAIGRAAIGATALFAPVLVAKPWVGKTAETPGAQTLSRSLAGRDLALGIATFSALHSGGRAAPGWVAASAAADAGDFAATIIGRSSLPRLGRWGVAVLSGGAALVGALAALNLRAKT